jgi:hypothetical protein
MPGKLTPPCRRSSGTSTFCSVRIRGGRGRGRTGAVPRGMPAPRLAEPSDRGDPVVRRLRLPPGCRRRLAKASVDPHATPRARCPVSDREDQMVRELSHFIYEHPAEQMALLPIYAAARDHAQRGTCVRSRRRPLVTTGAVVVDERNRVPSLRHEGTFTLAEAEPEDQDDSLGGAALRLLTSRALRCPDRSPRPPRAPTAARRSARTAGSCCRTERRGGPAAARRSLPRRSRARGPDELLERAVSSRHP